MAGSMLQPCNLRSGSFTSGRPVARSPKLVAARSGRNLCATVRADNVLIANTKGGGHAFIGLHLAKQLLDSGHSVTILNDGDEVSHDSTPLHRVCHCLAGHSKLSDTFYIGKK